MNDDSEITEEWRPVVGLEGRYAVSSLARVQSFLRTKRILKPYCGYKGYFSVALIHPEQGALTRKVHRLVAEAFIGPRPPGLQINHKNGIKADNRPVNLEYVTASENNLHAFLTGLNKPRKGETHASAKLTEADVRQIRQLYAEGTRYYILAKMFGIKPASVKGIITGRNWKHVK